MANNMTQLRQSADLAVMRLQHAQDRLQAELQFAELLCEQHPDQAKAWRPLIAKAANRAESAFGGGDVACAQTAVARAEELLAPVAAVAKTYTIHCVGHGHIDMNWMWSWPETVSVTHDTFATVLKLMDEFPQFRFSQSQASVYAIIEEFNPEMLARIAARVREGRWEVTASHWVENDNNLAGPEALCRHLLYTRQYMQRLFGLSPEDVPINWSPDTFGHAITMPTYLARGGVKYLYLHRPGAVGPARPAMFWWQGPDGSRVLVRNDMLAGYNGALRPDDLLRQMRAFAQQTGLRDLMFVYGVGDHGGGPTRRDIMAGLEMDTWPVFPNIRFATTREYFERIEAQGAGLPVLDCELNFEFTGCYTSESLIKRNNRFAENRLTDAELAASLAWLAQGQAYPADRLQQGWRDTLFCHFHDILPGSGVHDTRTYADGLYQKTMATTSMVETLAYRGLAAQVDTTFAGNPPVAEAPSLRLSNGFGAGVGFRSANGALAQSEQSVGGGNRPFVVVNPLAWPRAEVVETTIWDNTPAISLLPPLSKRSFAVRLSDGRSFAPQVVETGRFWGHEFVRLALPLEIAGLGYAAFVVTEEATAASAAGVWQLGERQPQPRSHAERYREGLGNDLVQVELDMTTGGIRSLLDKRTGVVLISPDQPAPILEYAIERPHGMTAWTIENSGAVSFGEVLSIKRTVSGSFKAAIAVKLRIHDSNVTLTYELCAGDPQLHLRVDAEWFERGTPQTGVPVLRMALPLALTGARGLYEIPFGAIGRDLNAGQEVPALQWVQVTGEAAGAQPAGCLLVNDSKYGFSLDGNMLRMTLIRSSYDPDNLPEIRTHEIHAGLRPLAGALPVAEAIRLGRNFNHALRLVGTDVHTGPQPAAATLIDIAPATVILSSVKKAEEGDALVLTFFDPTGEESTVVARINEQILGRPNSATEVDLMERPVARSTATITGGSVTAKLPGRGIVSIKVGFDGR